MTSSGVGAPLRRLGRYHLAEPLGGGPTGEVFRAKVYGVAGFERQFAVKRFHKELVRNPDVAASVSAAARKYGSLEHPRIARLQEYGVAAGETFTAVELVHGLDIARLIGATYGLSDPIVSGAVTDLISQVGRAVGYAHGRGISHLGLCPTNLICTPDGEVKVTDFGFLPPRLPRRPADDYSLAARIPYLAPEQLVGEPTSSATDVFQLGVVAYELLTGKRAFTGPTPLDVAQQILSSQPAEPALPKPLLKVLQRCLARSPFERFPDAGALADAVDAAVRASPLPGGRRDVASSVRKAMKRVDEIAESQMSGAMSFPLPAPPPSGQMPIGDLPSQVPQIGSQPLSQTIMGMPAPALKQKLKLPANPPGTAPGIDEEGITKIRRRPQGLVQPRIPPFGIPASIPSQIGPQPTVPTPPPVSTPPPVVPAAVANPPKFPITDLGEPQPTFGEEQDALTREAEPGKMARLAAQSVSPHPQVGIRPQPPAPPGFPLGPVDRMATVPDPPGEAIPEQVPQAGSISAPVAATPAPPSAPPAAAALRPEPPEIELFEAEPLQLPLSPTPNPEGSDFLLGSPPKKGGGLGVALAMLLVAGAGVGGFFAYQHLNKKDDKVASKTNDRLPKGNGKPIANASPDASVTITQATASDAAVKSAATSTDASAEIAVEPTATMDAAATKVAVVVTPDAGTDDESDKLTIESTPKGAKIYIDGSLKGRTPHSVEGASDTFKLVLIKPGYKLVTQEIKGNGKVAVTLEAVSPPEGPAGIKVRCRKKNRYYVFVDGADVGQLCPTERIGVDKGAHEVEIYDPVTGSRRTYRVKVKQTRNSLRVRVD